MCAVKLFHVNFAEQWIKVIFTYTRNSLGNVALNFNTISISKNQNILIYLVLNMYILK